MAFLNARERDTLALVADTLIPTDERTADPLYRCGAASLGLIDDLELMLERTSRPLEQQQFKLWLRLIEQGWFNALSAQDSRSFAEMPPNQREALLRAWANSDLALARLIFQSVKRLALALYYSTMPDQQPHPAWSSFGYSGAPPHPATTAPTLNPIIKTEPSTLSADVLVIGSGAGGGVVAGELASAGYDVIVVEKGEYFADFDGQERASTERMFEQYGALTNADHSLLILAGSTLGGGTTVNWAGAFRPPFEVLQEWARAYGFTEAISPAFASSLDAVMRRVHVTSDESQPNRQNAALERGCQALGYDVSVIARNVQGCGDCGFCNFGCPLGAKQGTLKTYLQDAADHGARIFVRATVEQVLHERGVATGAIITTHAPDGQTVEFTVKAKVVVAAAGSLHTPALLLRSGLGNANIGANLHLHPTTVIYGLFDQPIRGWEGAPMTRYTSAFADLDGRGYGVRLETAPTHPGLAALTIPWESGQQHKQVMAELDHMANIIVLTRDRGGGRVTLDRAGQPIIHYRLEADDGRHLMRGLIEALKIYRAAGAREVASPHARYTVYRDGDFDAFLDRVRAQGIRPNDFGLFSAHQMSSCRIGGSTGLGALDPTGQTYEVKNLYVADGSVLPTASGVNPMITIMGTAHYIAQAIKQRLK